MQRVLLLLATVVVAVPAASAGTAPTTLHARLAAVPPAAGRSGLFTATAVEKKDVVQLDWRLSAAHLSGPATAVNLKIGGAHTVVLPLCKPCGAHGSVGIVSGLWQQISGGQSVIVVSTRAHPKGEVRGTLIVG